MANFIYDLNGNRGVGVAFSSDKQTTKAPGSLFVSGRLYVACGGGTGS